MKKVSCKFHPKTPRCTGRIFDLLVIRGEIVEGFAYLRRRRRRIVGFALCKSWDFVRLAVFTIFILFLLLLLHIFSFFPLSLSFPILSRSFHFFHSFLLPFAVRSYWCRLHFGRNIGRVAQGGRSRGPGGSRGLGAAPRLRLC